MPRLPYSSLPSSSCALTREIVLKARVVSGVSAIADVETDVETTSRPEPIFDHELRPDPGARIGAEIARRAADRNTCLDHGGETDRAIDAGQAQLAVQRERADLLRIELGGIVDAVVRPDLVGVVAGHQDHGHGHADHGDVGDAIVETKRSLKRVFDQRRDAGTLFPVEDHAVLIFTGRIGVVRIGVGVDRARARGESAAGSDRSRGPNRS